MSTLSAALAAAMAAEQRPRTADEYGEATGLARQLRDLEREISDLKERLTEKNKQAHELRHKGLVDAMQVAGVDTLGLPAEGNLPGYDIELKPYYHAVISSEWPSEKRAAAHDFLVSDGSGDLLKAVVVVTFGRRELEQAQELADKLAAMGLRPEVELDVHWKTLTAWVQERYEKRHLPLSTDQLDLLGAKVGSVVKLTARKD